MANKNTSKSLPDFGEALKKLEDIVSNERRERVGSCLQVLICRLQEEAESMELLRCRCPIVHCGTDAQH